MDSFFPKHSLRFEIVPDAMKHIMGVFNIRWGFPTTMVIDKAGKIQLITSGGQVDPVAASKHIKEVLIHSIEECLK